MMNRFLSLIALVVSVMVFATVAQAQTSGGSCSVIGGGNFTPQPSTYSVFLSKGDTVSVNTYDAPVAITISNGKRDVASTDGASDPAQLSYSVRANKLEQYTITMTPDVETDGIFYGFSVAICTTT